MWKFRRIAAGAVARVDVCDDCDAVSISLGPTTIRVDRRALGSLIHTLIEAHEAIEREGTDGTWVPTATAPRGVA